MADYKLTAQVPVKALVTWDPAVRLKTSTGFVPAAKTLKTIQSNVLKFRNYYQQRAGSTYYRILNDDGDFIGYSGRQRSPLDPFITGNQVPTNMPADRVDQSRVDTEFALEVEERDRISATDRATDPDPLWAPGQPRYRLYGNLSKREGVNHGSLTWFAWLRSKNDLA